MIKINFNSNEIAEKKARAKKLLLRIYMAAWVISIFFGLLNYRLNQIEGAFYASKLVQMQDNLAQQAPAFEKAQELFEEKSQIAETLSNRLRGAASPAFILRSLENLSQCLDDKVWLQEIRFEVKDEASTADPEEEIETPNVVLSLTLKGNMVFSGNQNENGQLENLVKRIKEVEIFRQTKNRLDLSDMKVKKLKGKFYHNFALEFIWSHAIL